MSASLIVFKKRSFSSCPDDIFEDCSLSMATRGVLSYLIGRPSNWEIRIAHIKSKLGLKDHSWDKSRKEMIAAGYFFQKCKKAENGKWSWTNIVTDTKFDFGTVPEKTVPEKAGYGNSGRGKPANKANNPNSKPNSLHAKKMEEICGIKCWYAEDKTAVIKAIEDFGIEEVKKAVEELAKQGREPLPSYLVNILKSGDPSNAKAGANNTTKRNENRDREAEGHDQYYGN